MHDRMESDVLIIGASMAGSCLARQLKLKHPDLRIVVVDRKTQFEHWIGESMLEIFWDYASIDLKLGPYLDKNHLYKHGLRFFFDSPEKNYTLSEMSEIGRGWYDLIPAHQIDRKRFDEDICQFNRELGIDVRMGCIVEDVQIDRNSGHTVLTSQGEMRCRWLVDASGFNTPIGRKLGLIKPIRNHPLATRWARIRFMNDPDSLGDDAWRQRVNFTSRCLSTNHFFYDGYWFWMIPIDRDTYSIGLVWRQDMADLTLNSQEDFIDFLKQHRCLRDLLGEHYEVIDNYAMKNMSRIADQFYSTDRWFLTGMSGAFLDPLFSSGSAFLTDANRMIGDLIEADMAGDAYTFANKTVCYNAHSRWWLDNFLLHISGNYHGSYDLLRQLFPPLLMDYFGIILPTSMAKLWGYDPAMNYGDGASLGEQKAAMLEHSVIHKAHMIKAELAEFLQAREGLYAHNTGMFFDISEAGGYTKHCLTRGKRLTLMEIEKIQLEILRQSVSLALRRMAKSEGLHFEEEVYDAAIADVMMSDTSVTSGFAMLKERSMQVSSIQKRPMKQKDHTAADSCGKQKTVSAMDQMMV